MPFTAPPRAFAGRAFGVFVSLATRDPYTLTTTVALPRGRAGVTAHRGDALRRGVGRGLEARQRSGRS
ncbi:MAG: hypothetical protein EBS89_01795, partial [Proteobacteria bacterium]|nr:hypothetical protein [Pseudomonadota bacterium]